VAHDVVAATAAAAREGEDDRPTSRRSSLCEEEDMIAFCVCVCVSLSLSFPNNQKNPRKGVNNAVSARVRERERENRRKTTALFSLSRARFFSLFFSRRSLFSFVFFNSAAQAEHSPKRPFFSREKKGLGFIRNPKQKRVRYFS
jgi:hypothetical protein